MIKLKQILTEQGPTPAPKPNFKPGELTDPNFKAPDEIDPLSDNAKRRRYNDFIKKQEKELKDDSKQWELKRKTKDQILFLNLI